MGFMLIHGVLLFFRIFFLGLSILLVNTYLLRFEWLRYFDFGLENI